MSTPAQLIRWWKVPLINFTRAFFPFFSSCSCWGFVLKNPCCARRKSPFNNSKRKSTSNGDVLTIRDRGWWKCFDKMITGAWKQTLHVPQSFVFTKENQNLSFSLQRKMGKLSQQLRFDDNGWSLKRISFVLLGGDLMEFCCLFCLEREMKMFSMEFWEILKVFYVM
jgi:hypothetical protein